MIRILKGREPEDLERVRYRKEAAARFAHLQGHKPAFDGYEVARKHLLEVQGYKCAYCEMEVLEDAPVEHFRPKAHRFLQNGARDESRYFWLAWTWENLVVSCGTCNGPTRKDNWFPLEDEANALLPGADLYGDERPLFIDPTREDPIDHIRFVELMPMKWRPVARAGSALGTWTIDKLRLDKPPITDHYDVHVRKLGSLIDSLDDAMQGGHVDKVKSLWLNLHEAWFAHKAAFHALTYDVVDKRFPPQMRSKFHLDLEHPGPIGPSFPSRRKTNPLHDNLPEALKWQLCALGEAPNDHASVDELRQAIIALCEHDAFSIEDLARSVARAEATLQPHLRELERTGRLKLTGQKYRTPKAFDAILDDWL